MAVTITVCSTKGGVGKTTVCANLGGMLAELGQSVLFIDADIQPTLSSYYPLTQRAEHGLTQLITKADATDAISQMQVGAHLCDVIVSDDPEGKLENFILHTPDGRVRLKRVIEALSDNYDFILIDTQGAAGALQDVAVLAGDMLLSPIPPEILSAREFSRGMLGMLERLQPMSFMGAPVGPLYGLIYKMDRTVDARNIAQAVRNMTFNESKGKVKILETTIPSTVAYRDAASAQVPVHVLQNRQQAIAGADAMQALIAELFPHLLDDDVIDAMPDTHDEVSA